jgi:hypothetical protein
MNATGNGVAGQSYVYVAIANSDGRIKTWSIKQQRQPRADRVA